MHAWHDSIKALSLSHLCGSTTEAWLAQSFILKDSIERSAAVGSLSYATFVKRRAKTTAYVAADLLSYFGRFKLGSMAGFKPPMEEAKTSNGRKSLISAALAEFFCTAAFVFIATSAVTSGCHTADTAKASGAESAALETGRFLQSCVLHAVCPRCYLGQQAAMDYSSNCILVAAMQ